MIIFDIWTKVSNLDQCAQLCFGMMYVRLFISNPTMELQSGSISISSRDVGNRWAGWEIAHPGFGRSVNPISTRGGRLCPPPHTALIDQPTLGSFLHPCTLYAYRLYSDNNCELLRKSMWVVSNWYDFKWLGINPFC